MHMIYDYLSYTVAIVQYLYSLSDTEALQTATYHSVVYGTVVRVTASLRVCNV